jgi:hypothetical protein
VAIRCSFTSIAEHDALQHALGCREADRIGNELFVRDLLEFGEPTQLLGHELQFPLDELTSQHSAVG